MSQKGAVDGCHGRHDDSGKPSTTMDASRRSSEAAINDPGQNSKAIEKKTNRSRDSRQNDSSQEHRTNSMGLSHPDSSSSAISLKRESSDERYGFAGDEAEEKLANVPTYSHQKQHDKRKASVAGESVGAEDEKPPASKRQEASQGHEDHGTPLSRDSGLMTEPNSKRKAQNRAAQRAFRDRKERHLRDLEMKVEELERASEATNHENGRLRAQVDHLTTELREYQDRLSQSSSTPPDANVPSHVLGTIFKSGIEKTAPSPTTRFDDEQATTNFATDGNDGAHAVEDDITTFKPQDSRRTSSWNSSTTGASLTNPIHQSLSSQASNTTMPLASQSTTKPQSQRYSYDMSTNADLSDLSTLFSPSILQAAASQSGLGDYVTYPGGASTSTVRRSGSSAHSQAADQSQSIYQAHNSSSSAVSGKNSSFSSLSNIQPVSSRTSPDDSGWSNPPSSRNLSQNDFASSIAEQHINAPLNIDTSTSGMTQYHEPYSASTRPSPMQPPSKIDLPTTVSPISQNSNTNYPYMQPSRSASSSALYPMTSMAVNTPAMHQQPLNADPASHGWAEMPMASTPRYDASLYPAITSNGKMQHQPQGFGQEATYTPAMYDTSQTQAQSYAERKFMPDQSQPYAATAPDGSLYCNSAMKSGITPKWEVCLRQPKVTTNKELVMSRAATCEEMRARMHNHAKVISGELELDDLCNMLKAKARCGGDHKIIDEDDLDSILGPSQPMSDMEAFKMFS